MVNGGTQAANTRVAKVVRVEHGWVVHLVVGDAFDVARTVEPRVDRHGVATSAAARVSKGECLIVVRSGETTAGTRLACAGAGRASRPIRSACVESLVVSWLVGMVWFGPPAQVGTVNGIDFVPLA